MSSVSDLFSNTKKDKSLENLFASSAAAAGPVKRTISQRTVKQTEKSKAEESESSDSSEEEEVEQLKDTKVKRKRVSDDDDDLESRYLEKILDDKSTEADTQEKEEVVKDKEEEDSESDSDSDDDGESTKTAAKGVKRVDFKEDEIEKAERTIFIGNLNSKVITSKKDYKEFKSFFTKFGVVESIRFRSIAFSEALPRKVAYVKQNLHASRDSVNSYVVFKEKDSARKALTANGSLFLGLHIRVDSVAHPAKIDNKRTIFVGNLDFEEKEEELWNIFSECGEVESVRLVRDSKTNVGKGFGYVQFKDFLSVNKALLLNEKKLGEKKRKLRISRSKKVKPAPGGNNGRPGNNSNNRSRNFNTFTDEQKTKLGRAKRVLGKADRATAGNQVIEGVRARKGERAAGIKGGKNRVKKPRIRQRSTDFKSKK